MADAGLHMVALAVRPQARAQIVRGQSLADGADVVLLAGARAEPDEVLQLDLEF